MEFTIRQINQFLITELEKVLANFGECALEKCKSVPLFTIQLKYRRLVETFYHVRNDRQISVKIHFFVIISLKKQAKPKR